jgi:glycosyltransferase involved in cell wall biosynthesis
MNSKIKILRITTVASTMNVILKGQLSFLNQYYEVVAATAKFDNYFDEIVKREGVKVYEVGFTRKITPVKDLIALYTLIKIISEEKPEIIHTQTPKANLIGMIASFICRTPVRILSIVGMPVYNPTSMKGKLLHNLDLLTFKLATRVYPNSRGLYMHYSNWPELKNKIDIIGNGSSNGIDFNYFNPESISKKEVLELKNLLNIPLDAFVFVFLGRVVNDKGIRELIDAFINLESENVAVDSYLVIVGPMRDNDDPLPVSYKNILGSHSKIKSVGLQKEVRPYLMLANVFVFPSYREGLPGSLIQAAAMGLPLLASKIVGNEEIIGNVGGVLFEPRDAISLKKAMVTIYENQELRNELKKNVRGKALEKYSQEFYWKSLHAEYEKLIAENV